MGLLRNPGVACVRVERRWQRPGPDGGRGSTAGSCGGPAVSGARGKGEPAGGRRGRSPGYRVGGTVCAQVRGAGTGGASAAPESPFGRARVGSEGSSRSSALLPSVPAVSALPPNFTEAYVVFRLRQMSCNILLQQSCFLEAVALLINNSGFKYKVFREMWL